jgi:hypothetical protein
VEENLRSFERRARLKDVNMKMTAVATVTLLRNVPGPRLPKMVWLDPPNIAPISAPLPDCRRMAAIINKQARTWITTAKVYMTALREHALRVTLTLRAE